MKYSLILKFDKLEKIKKERLIRFFNNFPKSISKVKDFCKYLKYRTPDSDYPFGNIEVVKDFVVEDNIVIFLNDDNKNVFKALKFALKDIDIDIKDLGITIIDYNTFEIQSNIKNGEIAFLEADMESMFDLDTDYYSSENWNLTCFKNEEELLEFLNSEMYSDENWFSFKTLEEVKKEFSGSMWEKIVKIKNLEGIYK